MRLFLNFGALKRSKMPRHYLSTKEENLHKTSQGHAHTDTLRNLKGQEKETSRRQTFKNPVTSLNKEVRPSFLGDNSISDFGVFPLFLPLAITAFGGPEGYFSLEITAFGACGFIALKCYCRLEKWTRGV